MSEQTEQPLKGESKKDDNGFDVLAGPLAESLFVIVPLIVLTIVGVHKEKSFYDIISSSEWAFGAAVFFGQSLVKLVQTLIITTRLRNYMFYGDKLILVVSVIIVLGLMPSLIVLALMLTTEKPSSMLIGLQMIMFLVGLVCFIFAGAAVKAVEDKKDQEAKETLKNVLAKVSP
jgi:hypothetical protein